MRIIRYCFQLASLASPTQFLSSPPRSVVLSTPVDPENLSNLVGDWVTNSNGRQVYAPTEDALEDDKNEFYDSLNQLYTEAPNHDIKIILGDLNAKVGTEDYVIPVVGRYSVHEVTNDNGSRLVDFATGCNLAIKSTQFARKKIHKATSRSNDGRTNNQIDYVLIDGRHSSSIISVRTMRGPDSDTDHFLVKAKLRTRISTQTTDKHTKIERWNVAKLKEENNQRQYQVELRNRFQVLEINENESEDIDQRWNSIKTTITEAAEKSVGRTKKTKKKKWFDDECERTLKEANKRRIDYLSNPLEEKRIRFHREKESSS
ncbi:uncharacterized protein [Diabrotica undecimpunctata]|uniref:uncharacterized protein n=1 Tax=Diabrotica undecimpunctata TaxID=50387 RepID=UPI003B63D8BD